MTKFKIPPIRVPSDDCVVFIGRKIKDGAITDPGKSYQVHQGEWVEVTRVTSIAQYLNLLDLKNLSVEDTAKVSLNFEELCKTLSKSVTAWNWTGNDSEPLEQPYKHSEIIKGLTADEILWLVTAVAGETAGERKNDLAPSEPKL